jgi:hypothetical protein
MDTTTVNLPKHKLWNWSVGLGTAWGLIVTVIVAASEPTPYNLALTGSVWAAGLYTLGLYLTRGWWLPKLTRRPLRNAVLLGVVNAAVIETEFLLFEKLCGAQGLAASPNLLVDLLITMPWYTLMVLTFVKVQHRRRFSAATVLFLGGLYEVGGDGLAGQLTAVLAGDFSLFTAQYWLMIGLLFLWAFISVYSAMLLPPAWVIATTPPPATEPARPAWLEALRPLAWLPLFMLYLVGLLLLMGALGLG